MRPRKTGILWVSELCIHRPPCYSNGGKTLSLGIGWQSHMTTREILGCVVGFVTAAIMLRLLADAGAAMGIIREVDLPYPVEYSVGRYIDEIIDTELTGFGLASLAFSIAVGVVVGAIAYRRKIFPLKSAQERVTAIAWFGALTAILFITATTQLVFTNRTTGTMSLLRDTFEFGVPMFVSWIAWKWWKQKSAALANSTEN